MGRRRVEGRSTNPANVKGCQEEGNLDNVWPDGIALAMRDTAQSSERSGKATDCSPQRMPENQMEEYLGDWGKKE